MDKKYTLASGTQVREEDFGLLFYTMAGPRLFFLSSGDLLDDRFFQGEFTLEQWIERSPQQKPIRESRMSGLRKSLNHLNEKGVIVECGIR